MSALDISLHKGIFTVFLVVCRKAFLVYLVEEFAHDLTVENSQQSNNSIISIKFNTK